MYFYSIQTQISLPSTKTKQRGGPNTNKNQKNTDMFNWPPCSSSYKRERERERKY